jgi:L-threonylcarbamoyladenylate synthase
MGTRRRRVSVKSGRTKLDKWDDLRMQVFNNPTQNEIKMAAKALKDGNLVAFPTETVYGLGADAENRKAVSGIYSVKARPTDHPLIVHISSAKQSSKWANDFPDYAIKLANEFWPGPMTLIFKRSELAKDFITGGQDTIGLRVPAHQIAQALLWEFEKYGGHGVAAPSANKFGAVSPTTTDAVVSEIGDKLSASDFVLDGGQSLIGIESTIIDCTNKDPIVLRPGAVTSEMINKLLGVKIKDTAPYSSVRVSGMMLTHYSPKAIVKLNEIAKAGDGFIALADVPTPTGAIRLAAPTDLHDFAQSMYSSFREADLMGLKTIVVMPPLGDGIAHAIRDRLNKAAG